MHHVITPCGKKNSSVPEKGLKLHPLMRRT